MKKKLYVALTQHHSAARWPVDYQCSSTPELSSSSHPMSIPQSYKEENSNSHAQFVSVIFQTMRRVIFNGPIIKNPCIKQQQRQMDSYIWSPEKMLHALLYILHAESQILPLHIDSINENDSVANPDPTPRIASVHKSRFAEIVLVGCWMEAVYYGLLLFTIT